MGRSDDEQQRLVYLQDNEPANPHEACCPAPAMSLQVRAQGGVVHILFSAQWRWYCAGRSTSDHQSMTGPALRKSVVGRACIQPPCCSSHRAPVLPCATRSVAQPHNSHAAVTRRSGHETVKPCSHETSPLPLP